MRIKLENSDKYVIVDKTDYRELIKYGWKLSTWGYACRYVCNSSKTKTVFMHRLLLDAPKGSMTDHINGDRLDNRRSNIRLCTHRQNNQNRKSYSLSGYKGVSWDYNKWRATICVNRKNIRSGRFDTKEEAALAYNKLAKEYFGEFARLNVI